MNDNITPPTQNSPHEPPPSRHLHRLLIVLVALGCLGVTSLLAINMLANRGDGMPADAPGRGGSLSPSLFDQPLPLREFTLTNQLGEQTGTAELKGKPYIASFVFTRCATLCPRVLAANAELDRQLKSVVGEDNYRLVSITLDPEHDTVEVFGQRAKDWDADASHWLFLTGEKDKVRDLITGADGFRSPAVDDPDNPQMQIAHNSNVVLVDAAGRIRGYYDVVKIEQREKLTRDLQRLIEMEK